MSARLGFTLIELLVVIAIMAITGIFTLANFRSFGAEQNFKSAALDVQSLLRLAQTNATSGVKCQSSDTNALGWRVEYTPSTTFNLQCQNSSGWSSSVKQLDISNRATVSSIAVGNCNPTYINFAPLYGSVTSGNNSANCPNTTITITLQDTKGTNTRQLKVAPGGNIHE
mgnify:CR=1 FL=1